MTSSQGITWFTRGFYIFAALCTFVWYDTCQDLVDASWTYLTSTWVFSCVYFETWWATLCYALILSWPYTFTKIAYFKKYQIDPNMTWQSAGLKKIVIEAIVYCTPLMTLDTFMVKKYCGVPSALLTEQRKSWMKYERLMPIEAPSAFQVIWHLIVSFLIYDAIFYVFHMSLHKNLWLYKLIHADHHEHELLHGRVTNQLSVPERIILVLSANESLKILGAHPLTRFLFVPLFVGWLVENHSGYDLPWTLDKVVPFGLIGGSRYHFDHHMKGSRNYQPFFTHFDRIVNKNTKSKTIREKE